MADFPADLKYTRDHTWVRPAGNGRVRMGITDYAVQQQLENNVIRVELPKGQTRCEAEESFVSVESVTRFLDFYTPLAGTITAVNHDLVDSPEQLDSDAYDAWIIEVATTNADDMKPLLTAAQYADYIKE